MNVFPRLTTHSVLVVFLSVLVAACAHSQTDEMNITDVVWQPVWFDGSQSPENPEGGGKAHLRLKDGRVQGSGGCNLIAGEYFLTGSQISFSKLISTRRACIAGMEQEYAFLKALEKVSTWKRQDNLLRFYDMDERLVLELEAAKDPQ